MQAYVLARPTIRFRLHVLKAKNNKFDFIYAPKATANVEDAVLKIMGKDCTLRCGWTALASDGFEMHAYLPKPTATGSKVANFGSFISIDNRPMAASRGTPRKIVSTFKSRFSKANPSFTRARDPFFYLNILCPPASYDPNVEPAKDDVLFEDGDAVVALFNKILVGYYPETMTDTEANLERGDIGVSESPLLGRQLHEIHIENAVPRNHNLHTPHNTEASGEPDMVRPSSQDEQSQWTSTMYDIDEEDPSITQDDQHLETDEEEERQDVAISNPWTIARMNAPLKSKRPNPNGQLLSPAKSRVSQPSSPAPVVANLVFPVDLSAPNSSQRTNVSLLDQTLQRSARHELPPSTKYLSMGYNKSQSARLLNIQAVSPSFGVNTLGRLNQTTYESSISIPDNNQPSSRSVRQRETFPDPVNSYPPLVPFKERRRHVQHKSQNHLSFLSPVEQPNDTWFGQPMRGTQPANSSRPQKQKRRQEAPILYGNHGHHSSTPVSAADRLHCTSSNDIRAFFGPHKGPGNRNASGASSAEPQHRIGLPPVNDTTSPSPPDIADQLRAYAERETRALNSSSTAKAPHPPPSSSPSTAQPPIPSSPPPPPPRYRHSTLHRTPSRNLPLERIPRNDRTHHLVQHLNAPTTLVARLMETQSQSPSTHWTTPATGAYPGFNSRPGSGPGSGGDADAGVSAERLTRWVSTLETLLCARMAGERVAGVDVCGVLRAGVLRGVRGSGSDAGAGAGMDVVDLCENESEDVDADVAVPSVERIKVEDGGQGAEGDDEMLMDL
jgi:DNA mismatch repair ATPase MutL